MTNEKEIYIVGFLSVAAVACLYLFFWFRERSASRQQPLPGEKTPPPPSPPAAQQDAKATLMLRLQAYERMVLLAERIALPNLITRIPANGLTVRQYLSLLVEQIKGEFDHNVTQQIYVTDTVWQAVQKLREQNIFTLAKVAETLDADAGGTELAMAVGRLLQADSNAALHPAVLEAINHEARKLL